MNTNILKLVYVSVIFSNLIIFSCSTSDSENTEEQENRPPGTFNLKSVENGAQGISVTPTLTWNQAIDPDGDSVNYTLYLGTEENPITKYKENILETSFAINNPLALSTQYYWKIKAKDGIGGVTESKVFTFTTRGISVTVNSVTQTEAFPKRDQHTAVAFDNKLWVIGGSIQTQGKFNKVNDVWFSTDGKHWQEATSNASFSPRSSHESVVFDNKIWVIGGRSGSTDFKNDVWYSSDGVNWIEATSNAGFEEREGHTITVFDNKIWVIGGWNLTSGGKNDVWHSSDGVNWTQATSSAPFSKRSEHSMAVFDNKMWVIAGIVTTDNDNDVWHSNDGVNWIEATNDAAFTKRNAHSTAVFDDKIWVIGGYNSPNFKNDIWYSSDGISWIEATTNTPLSGIAGYKTIVFDDKIWVIGGLYSNDVWTID